MQKLALIKEIYVKFHFRCTNFLCLGGLIEGGRCATSYTLVKFGHGLTFSSASNFHDVLNDPVIICTKKFNLVVFQNFNVGVEKKMCCFSTKLTGSTLEFILLFILCKTFVFELVGDLKNQIRLILNDDFMIDKY